ncbi:MAG: galactose-1-phosphate uridylyltransferase [Clostridia bacterium]
MSQFRRDVVTGEWMIIAEERRGRPYHFGQTEDKNLCPFCIGNEHMTPDEIWRKEGVHTWEIRVVPNKYPAVCIQEGLIDKDATFYSRCKAGGRHEVVVEAASHELMLHCMEDKKISDVFRVFKQRFMQLSQIEGIEHVQIFKNHGKNGGASIRHSHSQVIALPFVPPRIQAELEGASEYYQNNGNCVYCDIIEKESENQQRIICKNEHFIAVLAFAPRFSYETWIIPLRHQGIFSQINEEQLLSLACLYKKLVKLLNNVLGEFSYNMVLHTAPYQFKDNYYHWHIELVPRVSFHAGFELATGSCISTISPEEAMQKIKEKGNKSMIVTSGNI